MILNMKLRKAGMDEIGLAALVDEGKVDPDFGFGIPITAWAKDWVTRDQLLAENHFCVLLILMKVPSV